MMTGFVCTSFNNSEWSLIWTQIRKVPLLFGTVLVDFGTGT